MEFHFLDTSRIDHLMGLQSSTSFYYKKMTYVTTENDLKEIFLTLAKHHEKSRTLLIKAIYPDQNPAVMGIIKKSNNYLGKQWRQVTIALLVNNRLKLVEYCRQAEINMLQEIPALLEQYEDKKTIVNILNQYQKEISMSIKGLSNVPTIITKSIKKSA